jgi:hypothetical protein
LWPKDWAAKRLDQIKTLSAPDAVFLTGRGYLVTVYAAILERFKGPLATLNTPLRLHTMYIKESGILAEESGEYSETIMPVSGGPDIEM